MFRSSAIATAGTLDRDGRMFSLEALKLIAEVYAQTIGHFVGERAFTASNFRFFERTLFADIQVSNNQAGQLLRDMLYKCRIHFVLRGIAEEWVTAGKVNVAQGKFWLMYVDAYEKLAS